MIALAIMASLCGFPRSLRRVVTGLRIGLWQAAARVAWNSTCRRDRCPPAIALRPRIAPLSFGTGAKPVVAAASPDVIRSSSCNSAINFTADTGPNPGINRSRFVLAASGSVCATKLSFQPGRVEFHKKCDQLRSTERFFFCSPWTGEVQFRKKLTRAQFSALMAQQEPCLVVFAACGSAHYWSREVEALGHDVKLIAPQYVRPFVKRQKNDAADAEAIVVAARQPEMRFVEPKTIEQQSRAAIFRSRERLVIQRTADVNAFRSC